MPKVAIVPSGPNECRVVPAEVHVQADGNVEWVNLTGDDITIYFTGAGTVFRKVHGGAVVPANYVSDPIAHSGKHRLDVHPAGGSGQPIAGRYPYSVYCKLTNNNAVGKSEPEIVVP